MWKLLDFFHKYYCDPEGLQPFHLALPHSMLSIQYFDAFGGGFDAFGGGYVLKNRPSEHLLYSLCGIAHDCAWYNYLQSL